MYYRQTNLVRKLIEPTFSILLLFTLSVFFHFPTQDYEYFALLFIMAIFSVQYGIYIAFFTFVELFLYSLLIGKVRGDDLLLYFFSASQWFQWAFLLLIGTVIGLTSTSQKERYEDVHMVNDELQKENEQFKHTIQQLNETRITLKARVLESNNHLATMFNMFKVLNHTHPEVVLNEAMNVLKEYFGTQKIAIYTVDDDKKSLRMKLCSERGNTTFLQSIFTDTATPVIKRVLTENKPAYRSKFDTKYAPTLIGPVMVQEKIQYLVFLDEIDFTKVTSQQFELFTWYLRLLGDRLDYASELWLADQSHRVFPGTNIYYQAEFEHLLEIEKERYEELEYPYSYFELQIPRHQLVTVNSILRKQLRDIDIVGYNANTKVIMVLLPGTEEQYLPKVKERVEGAIDDELAVRE